MIKLKIFYCTLDETLYSLKTLGLFLELNSWVVCIKIYIFLFVSEAILVLGVIVVTF